jgi:uncharacterized membrane protein
MINKLTAAIQRPHLYICIITLGILFKFIGLENKFVWLDEVFTMSHTSGTEMEKFVDVLPQDTLYTISDFNDILDMNERDYPITLQLSGLSQMIQVTPLHYYFLVFWHRLIGGDIIHYRLFSLFIFILSIPILYFFVRELGASRLTGLVTISLFCTAPFFHYYAQEARYYSLWGFAIILINLLLLIALRKNSFKWWILYSISAIFALYVSTLSGVILFGHLIFVGFNHRNRWKPYFIAGSIAFLAFLPWLLAMLGDRGSIMASTTWQYEYKPAWQTILGPLYSMATTFYTAASDTGLWAIVTDWEEYSLDALIIQTVLVVVILYASFKIIRNSKKEIVWLIACNSFAFIAIYYAFDFYSGRTLSIIYRYHIPIMIMTVVTMGLYLGKQIESNRQPHSFLFLALILGGIFSMYKISMNPCYHNHGNCERQLLCASEVSENENALIITGGMQWWLMYQFWELTQETESENIDILYNVDPENISQYLNEKSYSGIYTYSVSSKVKYELVKYFKSENSKQPLPISFADISDDFFNRNPWIKEESNLDTFIDLSPKYITIDLQIEDYTLSDSVFITGSHYSFGDWQPGAIQLPQVENGHWKGTFPVEKGEEKLTLDFTIGDWSHYLLDSTNVRMPQVIIDSKGDTSIFIKAMKWKSVREL